MYFREMCAATDADYISLTMPQRQNENMVPWLPDVNQTRSHTNSSLNSIRTLPLTLTVAFTLTLALNFELYSKPN